MHKVGALRVKKLAPVYGIGQEKEQLRDKEELRLTQVPMWRAQQARGKQQGKNWK